MFFRHDRNLYRTTQLPWFYLHQSSLFTENVPKLGTYEWNIFISKYRYFMCQEYGKVAETTTQGETAFWGKCGSAERVNGTSSSTVHNTSKF